MALKPPCMHMPLTARADAHPCEYCGRTVSLSDGATCPGCAAPVTVAPIVTVATTDDPWQGFPTQEADRLRDVFFRRHKGPRLPNLGPIRTY